MSDGIYVRVKYRDEICFEQKFRAISGDTIVITVDDLIAEKVAEEREECAKVCENDCGNGALNLAEAIRARGQS